MIINLCEYGCGQIAIKRFKTSRDHTPGKWCCSERHQHCPAQRKISAKANLNRSAHQTIYVENSIKKCVYECGNVAQYHYEAMNRWCCSKHYSACPAIKESKIQAGKRIDEETGLTVAVLRSRDAVKTKYETIDLESGLNGHQQTGHKATKTKEKIIDPNSGLNLLQISSRKAAITRKQIQENGLTIQQNTTIKIVETKTKMRRAKLDAGEIPAASTQMEYNRIVYMLTEANWQEYQHIIDPNNLGRNKNWHLDHIYSRYQGLIDCISPTIISHYTNLRIISSHENESKQQKCGKTKEQLLEDYKLSV